uniref:Uncharacterized protein n=2 Tax=Ditylum brightwellii TaxID=49249 RepID=A0A6V2QKM6_9STRA
MNSCMENLGPYRQSGGNEKNDHISSEAVRDNDKYLYEKWPEIFDEQLYGEPRPIPAVINDEFDKQKSSLIRSNPTPKLRSWSSKFFGGGISRVPSSPQQRQSVNRRKDEAFSQQRNSVVNADDTQQTPDVTVEKMRIHEEENVGGMDMGGTNPIDETFFGSFNTKGSILDSAIGFLNMKLFCGY